MHYSVDHRVMSCEPVLIQQLSYLMGQADLAISIDLM